MILRRAPLLGVSLLKNVPLSDLKIFLVAVTEWIEDKRNSNPYDFTKCVPLLILLLLLPLLLSFLVSGRRTRRAFWSGPL